MGNFLDPSRILERRGKGGFEALVTSLSAHPDYLPPSRFTIGDHLGKGPFATLNRGILNDMRGGEIPVAVRREYVGEGGDTSRIQETLLTRSLVRGHENVAHYYGFCAEGADVMIVLMEICEGGEAKRWLYQRRDAMEKEDFDALKLNLIHQAARGISAIHEAGVVHRNIQPKSILISRGSDSYPVVKITGLAVSLRSLPETLAERKAIAGFPAYIPLGDFRHNPGTDDMTEIDSLAVDVYAFGISMWELWTLDSPFRDLFEASGFHVMMAVDAISQEKRRPPVDGQGVDMPPFLSDLCQRCWSENPRERPKMWEVVEVLTEGMFPDVGLDERIQFLSTLGLLNRVRVVRRVTEEEGDGGGGQEEVVEVVGLLRCLFH